MADLLLEPAVLSSAPENTCAHYTAHTNTHTHADTLGLILRDVHAYLFTCTSLTHTHRSTVSTQQSLHFAH